MRELSEDTLSHTRKIVLAEVRQRATGYAARTLKRMMVGEGYDGRAVELAIQNLLNDNEIGLNSMLQLVPR